MLTKDLPSGRQRRSFRGRLCAASAPRTCCHDNEPEHLLGSALPPLLLGEREKQGLTLIRYTF